MAAVFCSADRGRSLLLKEFLKKRPVFQMPPIQAKGRDFFPKPSVLTLVLASQINLLWIPNFNRMASGGGESGGDGVRRREEGDCVQKKKENVL